MKITGTKRMLILLVILALNIFADQITKAMVRHSISFYDQHLYLGGHFTLLRTENTGAFLSLGDKLAQPFRFIVLSLLPAFALAGALTYVLAAKKLNHLISAGIIFCIGGGVGNLYDRVVHGSVTDFMHLKFGALQTGIFNVADVSIMVGLGLILLDGFTKRKNHKNLEAVDTMDTEQQSHI